MKTRPAYVILLVILLEFSMVRAKGAEFSPVSSKNYVDGFDVVHLEYEETEWGYNEWEIGRTKIRYDMADLIVRGEWESGAFNTWRIQTDEWAIRLEATSMIVLEFGGIRPAETNYGFDLSLSKLDGTWSHTLENLGMWLMKESPLLAFDGSVLSAGSRPVGEFWQEPGEIGSFHTYYRQNTQIPFTWENGGSFDTGMDGGGAFLGQAPTTFLDVPIGDDRWALSMNLAMHDGDLYARFGFGQEISRDLTLIPEPQGSVLLIAGLVGLWLSDGRRRRGRRRS